MFERTVSLICAQKPIYKAKQRDISNILDMDISTFKMEMTFSGGGQCFTEDQDISSQQFVFPWSVEHV